MTGKPCISINLKDFKDIKETEKDELWTYLLRIIEAGYVITAPCGKKQISEKEYSELGLCSEHAYSVLKSRVKDGEKSVFVRNPWGTFGWKEDFNNLINDRKGMFWMNFDAFLTYFYSIDVCKLNYNLYEKRSGGHFSTKKILSFKIRTQVVLSSRHYTI